MKIVVLMDSFKGSLSSQEACSVVCEGIKEQMPSAQVRGIPIADGGEGSLEAISQTLKSEKIRVKVTGPLADIGIETYFLWLPDSQIAVIEMAKVAGLPLLLSNQLNPLNTTTYGVGQMVEAACLMKPAKILLAVGGSSTVDGGVGAAAALGWKFKDADGKELVFGGAVLEQIASIEKSASLNLPEIEVLCDVENPLLGVKGAAHVFAPQKGADKHGVDALERGMENLTYVVKKSLGIDINVAGAGASGGLAAGALAFMDAKLVSGIDTIINLSGIEQAIDEADIVVTGEGCFDTQSLDGKVVSGLSKRAVKHRKKLYVLAGSVEVGKDILKEHGISDAFSCVTKQHILIEVLKSPQKHLKRIACDLAQTMSK